MNGTADHAEDSYVSKSGFYQIQPMKDAESELFSSLKDKPMENSQEICNGNDDETVSDSVRGELTKSGDVQLPQTNSAVSSALNNLVVVGSLPNAAKNEIMRNPKLFVLNGNILKEANDPEKGKNDNINIICLTNGMGNIIKKINYDAVVKAVSKVDCIGDQDGEKSEYTPTTLPTFIQLGQSNLKNLSSKITLNMSSSTTTPSTATTTKQAKNNYEILRTKLESVSTQFTSDESSSVQTMRKMVDKNRKVFKKDQIGDSPAVAHARNELIESRRTLIQTAMRKHMPMYRPPANYTGPTYTCEECFDTFSSEDSVINHKDRRSVLFTYACPDCGGTLEFYNRCTFSMHIRSHNANIKANSLIVSTIPVDKLNFKLREEDDSLIETSGSANAESTIKSTVSGCSTSVTSNTSINVREPTVKKRRKPTTSREVNFDDDKECRSGETTPSPLRDERKGSSEDSEAGAATTTKEDAFQSSQVCANRTKSKKKNSLNSIMKLKKSTRENLAASRKTSSTYSGGAITYLNNSTQVVTLTPIAAPTKGEDIVLTSSDEDESFGEEEEDSTSLVPCRECKKEVPNLTRHFRGTNRPMKEYPCDKCDFFNPSECALKSHVRMLHTRAQPYVCPDCGFFFNKLDSFLSHVKTVCFYHYKTIRFKCPECSSLKPSVGLFDDHLRRCHVREVFKCSHCITSSYSIKVVQEHMEKTHPDAPPQVMEGYRCMLCPNLLIAKPSIQVHVKKHVYSLQHLRYVYICNHCKKYASLRVSKFEDHYNVCPDREETSLSSESPPPPSRSSNVTKKAAPSRPRKSSDTLVVPSKEKDPLSIEDWETDRLKAEYGAKTKVCVMCRTTRLQDHSRSLFCNACVSYVNAEGPTEGTAGNENVPSADVGRSKRKFKCRLCKQFMNRDWSTITRHYERDHHADFDVAPKSRAGGESNGGQRKRKPSLKTEAAVAAKATKTEPKYSCVKCGMSTSVRIDFHAHITAHKSQSNTDFQCLECGECFIVKPSLEKHLLVVHKVRDLKEYYRENKVDDDDEIKQEMLAENQCEVCYMECGSKQNYDKHIRTHGMAFVAMQSRVKS